MAKDMHTVKARLYKNLLTPGCNLKISGYKIRIDGSNAANGIYFVNQATSERTRVDVSDIVTNNPSELIVMIPDLSSRTYLLEVTTQYTPGTLLKEPRKTMFDKPLTVE
ncbi:MAG: DUF4469 domain-containing protein [Tannerella sp.]|jgi:hypothetical protein|nr:DUF4469 domain-containing protein [Tannerella sp.]